jgi:hypothetical protein
VLNLIQRPLKPNGPRALFGFYFFDEKFHLFFFSLTAGKLLQSTLQFITGFHYLNRPQVLSRIAVGLGALFFMSEALSSSTTKPQLMRQTNRKRQFPKHLQDLLKIVLARRIDDTVPGYGEEITTTPERFCVSPNLKKLCLSLAGSPR